jgi:hypothetical protein
MERRERRDIRSTVAPDGRSAVTLLFCNYCGDPVEENPCGKWEGQDGSTSCSKRRAGHLVEQIVPDPPEDTQ